MPVITAELWLRDRIVLGRYPLDKFDEFDIAEVERAELRPHGGFNEATRSDSAILVTAINSLTDARKKFNPRHFHLLRTT
ncbi:hypothetical protein LBMAG48_23840 [Phycisphaerae bacterium]|jgi:hypothetical protein|nr:hypothetical protein LBMAG48_23840 [Phycisphaerae bacterium]